MSGSALARLKPGSMALTLGLLTGPGLFAATVWLLLKGGATVGPTLGRLGYYLPGYSVTWLGAVAGLVYGAVIGGVAGYAMAWIYNRLADRRRV